MKAIELTSIQKTELAALQATAKAAQAQAADAATALRKAIQAITGTQSPIIRTNISDDGNYLIIQ